MPQLLSHEHGKIVTTFQDERDTQVKNSRALAGRMTQNLGW